MWQLYLRNTYPRKRGCEPGLPTAGAAFVLQQQRVVVVTGTVGPSKPRMFTVWTFTGRVCRPCPGRRWSWQQQRPACVQAQPRQLLCSAVTAFTSLHTLRGRGFNVPILHMRKLRLICFELLTKWWGKLWTPVFWFQSHISVLIFRRWRSRHWGPSTFLTCSLTPGLPSPRRLGEHI